MLGKIKTPMAGPAGPVNAGGEDYPCSPKWEGKIKREWKQWRGHGW